MLSGKTKRTWSGRHTIETHRERNSRAAVLFIDLNCHPKTLECKLHDGRDLFFSFLSFNALFLVSRIMPVTE